MAMRHVEVGTYTLVWRPQPYLWSFPGSLRVSECHGYLLLTAKNSSDSLYFAIAADSLDPLPEAKTYVAAATLFIGSTAIKLRNLHPLLDLLRNEKPIFMTLFDTIPRANGISTSAEPVGEGTDVSP